MSKWSEQRQLVARKVVEVERTRLVLQAAQSRFAHSFRRRFVVPGVLLAGFAAGLWFGLGRPRDRARMLAAGARKLAAPSASLLQLVTALGARRREQTAEIVVGGPSTPLP